VNAAIVCDSSIVKWCHGTNPRYQRFIRGIKPDRSFFGDIPLYEPRRAGINVEGHPVGIPSPYLHGFGSLLMEIGD
jgi:hypothetical protein